MGENLNSAEVGVGDGGVEAMPLQRHLGLVVVDVWLGVLNGHESV